MRRRIVAGAALVFSLSAKAEIKTKIEGHDFLGSTRGLNIQLICRDCGPFETLLREAFTGAGFKLVAAMGDASHEASTIVVQGTASVKDGEHVITVATDDVMSKTYQPVPPNLDVFRQAPEANFNVQARGWFEGDIATGYNAAKLGNQLGGASGGWLGMIFSEVLPVFANSVQADRSIRPGLVAVKVTIRKQAGESAILDAVTASDEAVDPKDLVRATFERLAAYIREHGRDR